MNENIEIAKLATQLTLAILEDRNDAAGKIAYKAKAAGANKELPDFLLVFDTAFAHLQETLKPQ